MPGAPVLVVIGLEDLGHGRQSRPDEVRVTISSPVFLSRGDERKVRSTSAASRAQRADGALLARDGARTGRSGRSRIAFTCVILSISSSGTPSSCLDERLGRRRPRRVGVRVVALPGDRVDADACRGSRRRRVVDEAGDDALAEHARSAAGRRSPGRSTPGGARRRSRRARGSTGSSRCRPPTARSSASGNLRSTGDHSRSAAACTMLIGWSVISTSIGASTAVIDEPRRRADVQAHDRALVARTPARTGPSGRCGSSASRASPGSRRT